MENTAGLLFMSFNRAAFPVLQHPIERELHLARTGQCLKTGLDLGVTPPWQYRQPGL
jgi:hypothetical protein